MKTLLILVALIISSAVCLGQEKDSLSSNHYKQFIKDYSYIVFRLKQQEISQIKDNSRIFFNYGDIPGNFKIYLGKIAVIECKQVRDFIEDKTEAGDDYLGFVCTTKNSGTLIMIQVFKKPEFGIRIIDGSDLTITLYEN